MRVYALIRIVYQFPVGSKRAQVLAWSAGHLSPGDYSTSIQHYTLLAAEATHKTMHSILYLLI